MLGRVFASGEEGHEPGDLVSHYRDPEMCGVIVAVSANRLSVDVLWDGDVEPDFQWANKVVRREDL